jgi:hypothetical protein
VDKKRIIGKNGGPRRGRGTRLILPPPPKKKMRIKLQRTVQSPKTLHLLVYVKKMIKTWVFK